MIFRIGYAWIREVRKTDHKSITRSLMASDDTLLKVGNSLISILPLDKVLPPTTDFGLSLCDLSDPKIKITRFCLPLGWHASNLIMSTWRAFSFNWALGRTSFLCMPSKSIAYRERLPSYSQQWRRARFTWNVYFKLQRCVFTARICLHLLSILSAVQIMPYFTHGFMALSKG